MPAAATPPSPCRDARARAARRSAPTKVSHTNSQRENSSEIVMPGVERVAQHDVAEHQHDHHREAGDDERTAGRGSTRRRARIMPRVLLGTCPERRARCRRRLSAVVEMAARDAESRDARLPPARRPSSMPRGESPARTGMSCGRQARMPRTSMPPSPGNCRSSRAVRMMPAIVGGTSFAASQTWAKRNHSRGSLRELVRGSSRSGRNGACRRGCRRCCG